MELLAPSRVGDDSFDQQLARLQRFSVRPKAWARYYRQTMTADVADVLPLIRTPTLVLNRTGNRIVPVEQSRVAAAAIEGARFVELPGTDHLAFSEGTDRLVDEVEEFLTGARTGADPDRMLTTLLFTDIVSSTTLAAKLGDRRWRDVLDQHYELGRGELARFGGREVATTGDGFFVRGADLGGLVVHIAARVAALADNGEVLVSSTVKDVLVGADVGFDDRQDHELKGVPGTWRLFAATPGGQPL
jgi:class 3 adenylate cyclase